MNRDIQLHLFCDGKPVREPVCITITGLREALLVASDFNEARVNQICKTLDEDGHCRMVSEDGAEVFEVSKILKS